jgi:hypothetical protein
MDTSISFPLQSSNITPGFQKRVEEDGQISAEIIRLRTTHELWKLYAPEWDLYSAAYEGGPEFAKGTNIFKHQRENPEDFADRGTRLHYFNYCEPIVDFFSNFIYAETIQRNGGKENTWYQEFIADVDKKGNDVSYYMKAVSDDTQIYGMSYTLVDLPKLDIPTGEVLTKQNEEDLKIRPYWVLIKPEEIIDWEVDAFEKVVYAKRLQYVTKNTPEGAARFERYVEWWPDKTVLTDVNVTDTHKPFVDSTETIENKLGSIPLECVRHKRSKRHPYMGNSFLRDFAYNNREVMNYTSLLQEFLYKQCFNILAKESDTGLSLRDQNDGIIGTSNVIEYPKGGEAPAYISPPVHAAEFIVKERQQIIDSMFQRACQDTANEMANGGASSGFSQAQSFSKTVPFIATRADTLEKAENAFMTLTMKLVGKVWEGKVKYKDRYELTNITDAISQLTSIFRDLMLPSETFVKEELKLIVAQMDGKIQPDKMAKILSEIDNMDYPDFVESQKLALIGSAGQSPAAQGKSKQTGTMAEAAQESTGKTGATTKLKPRKQK